MPIIDDSGTTANATYSVHNGLGRVLVRAEFYAPLDPNEAATVRFLS